MKFKEWPEGVPLMGNVDDAGLVVEGCYSDGVSSALLYAENLTANFFDLSSGEAGAILQKLRTYKIRLAVVYSPDRVRFSSRFQEMAAEEGRTGFFRL